MLLYYNNIIKMDATITNWRAYDGLIAFEKTPIEIQFAMQTSTVLCKI